MKVLICTFGNAFHYPCRLFYSLLQNIAEVKLFFFSGYWNRGTENFVSDYIRTEKPDLIAVSLVTYEFGLSKKLVETVRRHRASDETKIIFGGPHAFLSPEDCLDVADFVCSGEGEYTLIELCEQFKDRGKWALVNLERIPNLIYRPDNSIKQSLNQDFLYSRQFIDQLPFPAYGEREIYVYDGSDWNGDICVKSNLYYAFASRGCPNRCSYCINAVYKYRKVTNRSPEKVIEELVLVREKFPNLNRICFVDSIFGWQREWLRKFARLYKKHIYLPFEVSSFPGQHSEDMIELLAESGLKKVNVGIQSCSQRVLKEIFMRHQKTETVIPDNCMYVSRSIIPAYDFIVDNPFETPAELLETVEIVRQLKRPSSFQICSLFFFPHYLLTQRAEREGLIEKENDRKKYYDKITTTHMGDQYSQKMWYVNPFKSISGGDEKAVLNWLLTCYGDRNIPRRVTDFVFNKYKEGRWYWMVALAYYYKLIDRFYYKIRNRLSSLVQTYRRYGLLKTSRHILKKIFLRCDSQVK